MSTSAARARPASAAQSSWPTWSQAALHPLLRPPAAAAAAPPAWLLPAAFETQLRRHAPPRGAPSASGAAAEADAKVIGSETKRMHNRKPGQERAGLFVLQTWPHQPTHANSAVQLPCPQARVSHPASKSCPPTPRQLPSLPHHALLGAQEKKFSPSKPWLPARFRSAHHALLRDAQREGGVAAVAKEAARADRALCIHTREVNRRQDCVCAKWGLMC